MKKNKYLKVRNIGLIIISIVCIVLAASYIHLKWRNTHGWLINLVYFENSQPKIFNTIIVIDTNVKSAILRVEEYVKKDVKRPLEVEVTEYIGRMPWRKFGIYEKGKT